MKRASCAAALVALLLLASPASAATDCPTGVAAGRGGEVAFNRDIEAIEQEGLTAREASDILGRCVGSMSLVVTAPWFPSMQEIFNQIMARICALVSAEVYGVYAEVNAQIGSIMAEINGSIRNGAGDQDFWRPPPIRAPVVIQSVGGGQPLGAQPGGGSAPGANKQFWSDIWR